MQAQTCQTLAAKREPAFKLSEDKETDSTTYNKKADRKVKDPIVLERHKTICKEAESGITKGTYSMEDRQVQGLAHRIAGEKPKKQQHPSPHLDDHSKFNNI